MGNSPESANRPGSAAEKPIVAIWQFACEDRSGNNLQLTRQLTDLTRLRIPQTGLFRVVDKKAQSAILATQAESFKDCYDESCAVRAGKLLSANKLIYGNLMRFGNNCTLALRLLDVETGSVERSAVDSQPCDTENFPSMISKLVYNLSFETGIGEEALKESMNPPPPPPKPDKPMSKGERSFWFGLGALVLSGILVAGAVSTNNEDAKIALGLAGGLAGWAGFGFTMGGIAEW